MKRIIPISIIVVGLSLLYPMQRWMDETMPRDVISEDSLYLTSGSKIKRMSLGLDGIIADVYWIRTTQYFGRKVLESGQPISSNTTKNIRMDLLAPLLKIIVELDPHHLSAYRFGAMFLPERDLPAAIALLERGIRENPNEWRLYQDIGYIYWQAGDYEKAADYFEEGSNLPGAFWFMKDMAGLMRIKGGSRDTARQVYSTYLESDDERVRSQAWARLHQLQALDEVEALNDFLGRYKAETGRCPSNLRIFARNFRAAGFQLNEDQMPVDPQGYAYAFDPETCKVMLAPESTVPQ